jgi:hypothetical protein
MQSPSLPTIEIRAFDSSALLGRETAVGEVHQLILDVGVDTARTLAFDKRERQVVETAFAVLSDERFAMNILHSGFAMTALPHRSPRELIWERIGGPNGELRLHIESGHLVDRKPVGIPYGSIARLILIHLSSEAVKNNSRVVELGPSMNAFMRRMGISPGGKSLSIIKDQSKRISLCRLTFFSKRAKNTLVSSGSFIRNAVIPDGASDQETSNWQGTVELDEAFFKSLQEHPLPLREAAIRQLSGQSMAIDLYVFLSYRLHALDKPTPVTWKALYSQFGGGYREQWVFVREIKHPLKLALAAYPEAKIDIAASGLVLYPSDSPVSKIRPRATARLLAEG